LLMHFDWNSRYAATFYLINIIIIFFHGLGRLTCSTIDALPSFPGSCEIPSRSFVI